MILCGDTIISYLACTENFKKSKYNCSSKNNWTLNAKKARIILCVERKDRTFVVRFSALNHCSGKCNKNNNNNNNIKCLFHWAAGKYLILRRNMAF